MVLCPCNRKFGVFSKIKQNSNWLVEFIILPDQIFWFHTLVSDDFEDSFSIITMTEMVGRWKDALPSENYTSRFLGWVVVFYIRTEGQRTG